MEYLDMLLDDLEDGRFTSLEIVLSGLVLFLTGILVGILISPKKYSMIGCNNGNGSCGCSGDCCEDFDDLAEEFED